MEIKEMGYKDVDWIHLAHEEFHLWAVVMNLRVPKKAGIFF